MEDHSTATLSRNVPVAQDYVDLEQHHATGHNETLLNMGGHIHTRRCLTFQIPINESWLGAICTVQQVVHEILVGMLDTFRQPIMNSATLMGVSILLLLFDKLLVYISGMIDTLLLTAARTTTTTITTTTAIPPTNIASPDAAWQNKLQDMASLFLKKSVGFFLNGSEYPHGSSATRNPPEACLAGDSACDNDTSSSIAGKVLLLATALAFMANTSYFGMLMSPLYSCIMDASSTSFSTEFLLCILLVLFGIEILTVLSFFLLGYKVLLSPTVAAVILNSGGDSGIGVMLLESNNDNTVMADEASQQFDLDNTGSTINLLLFLATVIWIFCVVTSTIVRLALYHSMGE